MPEAFQTESMSKELVTQVMKELRIQGEATQVLARTES